MLYMKKACCEDFSHEQDWKHEGTSQGEWVHL